MKHLLLASLVASALASSAASAAVPTELCVSGTPLAQPAKASAGASKVTDCQWPASAIITADATATSLTVSGGTAANMVTFDLGTPTNAFALTIADAFTTAGQIIITGTLIAGSSVSITGLKVTIPASDTDGESFVDLGGLTMTDSSLKIEKGVLTSAWACAGNCYGISLPSGTRTKMDILKTEITLSTKGVLWGVQMAYDKVFDDATLTISGNTITGSGGTARGIYLARTRALFKSMFPTEKGFRGMAVTDWSKVSDATARTSYGKVTYKITDNTFVNTDHPWVIYESEGADMTITGNTAYLTSGVGKPVVGKLSHSADHYPVTIIVSDNALTSSAGKEATIEIGINVVPVKSTITVSKNVITTGELNDATILRLSGNTLLPAVNPATFTVSANRLVALDGTTGIQAKTFVVSYTATGASISPSAYMTLCSNVVLGTAIDTDELTKSTFKYADKPIPLNSVSICPALNGAPSTHFGAACGVLFSATAAMAIAAFA